MTPSGGSAANLEVHVTDGGALFDNSGVGGGGGEDSGGVRGIRVELGGGGMVVCGGECMGYRSGAWRGWGKGEGGMVVGVVEGDRGGSRGSGLDRGEGRGCDQWLVISHLRIKPRSTMTPAAPGCRSARGAGAARHDKLHQYRSAPADVWGATPSLLHAQSRPPQPTSHTTPHPILHGESTSMHQPFFCKQSPCSSASYKLLPAFPDNPPPALRTQSCAPTDPPPAPFSLQPSHILTSLLFAPHFKEDP